MIELDLFAFLNIISDKNNTYKLNIMENENKKIVISIFKEKQYEREIPKSFWGENQSSISFSEFVYEEFIVPNKLTIKQVAIGTNIQEQYFLEKIKNPDPNSMRAIDALKIGKYFDCQDTIYDAYNKWYKEYILENSSFLFDHVEVFKK